MGFMNLMLIPGRFMYIVLSTVATCTSLTLPPLCDSVVLNPSNPVWQLFVQPDVDTLQYKKRTNVCIIQYIRPPPIFPPLPGPPWSGGMYVG